MIRILEDLPDDVVGFEASGHVEAGDYKTVLDPAITAALASHGSIRLLYVLGSDFEGYSGGAMWEDTKVGVSHWSKWDRIAVVTDNDRVKEGIRFFGWMVPGDVKTFALDGLADATAWVSE